MSRKYHPMYTPSQLHEAMIYLPDTGEFIWKARPRDHFFSDNAWNGWNTKYPGRPAGSSNGAYHQIAIGRKSYLAHRVAWAMTYGAWPTLEIDHINHDRFDNRIENLREVTRAENSRNIGLKPTNKFGAANIRYRAERGHWCVEMKKNDRTVGRGRFATKEQAIQYRDSLASRLGFHENHGKLVESDQ